MKTRISPLRWATFLLLESFVLFTALFQISKGEMTNLLLCFVTLFLVAVPFVFPLFLPMQMKFPLFFFLECYAIGALLGDCWHLYDQTRWWDKLLHFSGGVVFALFGLWLLQAIWKQPPPLLASVLFAFCFSVTLAVLWEFLEFGSDRIFGTDMQRDTWLSALSSYALGEEAGRVAGIENITEVTVNGQLLGEGGYLDIGLVDSMMDMLVETVGALAVSLFTLLDRHRHPLLFYGKRTDQRPPVR